MSRKLILFAALPLLFAGPAFAQSSDQAPAATETPAPPPADTPAAGADEPTTDATGMEPAAGSNEPMTGDAGSDMGAEGTADPNATATSPDTGTSTTAADGSEILTEESGDQILADRLMGMPVVDMAGEEIGEVEDILLDKNGQVAGIVLVTGQVLGLGGKTVAVSWQDISSAENAESITLNLTEEQLAAAPEFRTKEEVEAEQMENTAPAAGGGMTPSPTPDPAAPANPQ